MISLFSQVDLFVFLQINFVHFACQFGQLLPVYLFYPQIQNFPEIAEINTRENMSPYGIRRYSQRSKTILSGNTRLEPEFLIQRSL